MSVTTIVWPLREDKRYICVGTHLTDAKAGKQGRVLVYNLKDNVANGRTSYKTKLLGEVPLSDLVASLQPFMGGYLLAAAGCRLSLLKVDSKDKV